MASSGGSSSSPSPDVFLSFRGPDTRNCFIGHLRKDLVRKGIDAFIDDDADEGLKRGKQIRPALLEAIEGATISVIVFSENYAASEWCLDELAHILHCQKSKQQTVYPVFYKVAPSDLRDPISCFGKALAQHKDSERVVKWKEALTEASEIAGFTYKISDGYESAFIDTIVEKIFIQVCCHGDFIIANPIGIECRLKEMDNLLGDGLDDVRMLGIWGMAGIGKSTIAKAVYNSLASKFEGCCFLENVGKKSKLPGGPVKLLNMLLSKILWLKRPNMLTDASEGMNVILKRLSRKRVLIILDDVDQPEQVRNLVGKPAELFGPGSRVIITTRDKRILTSNGVREDQIYKPKELDEREALELFRANAFPTEISIPVGYAPFAKDILEYAQGLPLHLQHLGQLLHYRTVDEWKERLHSHIKPLPPVLHETYNALDDSAKQVFLDIACFFKGKHKNHVIQLLEKGEEKPLSSISEEKPLSSISVLQEKDLIYIQENHIYMHKLLEELGKEIVHKESPQEPRQRSRLWFPDDVYRILSEGEGTDTIRGVIVFPSPHAVQGIPLSETCFSGMTKLKYFISSNAKFSGINACLPNELRLIDSNELRLIDWPRFPLDSLNHVPKKLVKLNMPGGLISKLGERFKRSINLKYINLENCKFLKEIPNFSDFPNLRDLNLNYCTSLVKVDDSVGTLQKLVALSLSGCQNLETLPTRIALTSVKHIIFRDCRKVRALPVIGQVMECLTWLDLSGTGIEELPDISIKCLRNLEELILRECENLTSLPASIDELQHLRFLDLQNCSKLEALPANLKSSDKLSDLNLGGCRQLLEIPELPQRVESVNAADCVQLERFAQLSNMIEHKRSKMIKRITLSNCGTLCDSLVHHIAEARNILPSRDILFRLFLSCWQSEFEVVFPGSEVPTWFRDRKELKELTEESKFCFEVLPYLRQENRGLAICAAAEVVERINPDEQKNGCSVTAIIDINAGSITKRSHHFTEFMKCGHLWLCYIPFNILGYYQSPPFTCGVTLKHESQGSLHCTSYGFHLVQSCGENC